MVFFFSLQNHLLIIVVNPLFFMNRKIVTRSFHDHYIRNKMIAPNITQHWSLVNILTYFLILNQVIQNFGRKRTTWCDVFVSNISSERVYYKPYLWFELIFWLKPIRHGRWRVTLLNYHHLSLQLQRFWLNMSVWYAQIHHLFVAFLLYSRNINTLYYLHIFLVQNDSWVVLWFGLNLTSLQWKHCCHCCLRGDNWMLLSHRP